MISKSSGLTGRLHLGLKGATQPYYSGDDALVLPVAAPRGVSGDGRGGAIMAPITGTEGDDTINGTSGNDEISALGGNDRIRASAGTDTVDGGAGNDLFSILVANLGLGASPHAYTITGSAATDASGTLNTTFTGIEQVFVSDTGGVTINASAFAGALSAFTGGANDVVTTGSGADDIQLGGGLDTIDLGAGSADRIYYYNSQSASIEISDENGAVVIRQGSSVATVRNTEFFRVSSSGYGIDASLSSATMDFYDTSGYDEIIGTTGDNIFYISTFNGYDTLAGNGGADTFIFSYISGVGAEIFAFDSDDRIDLSNIEEPLSFIGTGLFTGVAGQYRTDTFRGQTLLVFDTNGDRFADRVMTLELTAAVLGETAPGSNILRIVSVISPNPGADVVNGTEADDTIETGGGDDIVHGNGGNDRISGGADNDQLFGDAGTDTIYGEDGDDQLDGGSGQDYLDGGDGDDTLTGSGPDGDSLFGGLGNDILTGSGGPYRLFGDVGGSSDEDGDDRITLTAGTTGSWVEGGAGNDIIQASGTGRINAGGGTGNDTLTIEGFSQASINLGEGDDRLYLGVASTVQNQGNHSIMLDTGRDNIVVTAMTGGRIDVRRFDAGEQGDRLDLSIYGADPFGTGVLTIRTVSGNVFIEHGASGRIYALDNSYGLRLENLSAYNLGVNNPFYSPIGLTLDDAFSGSPTLNVPGELVGADGNDVIRGFGGNDRLFGSGGNDTLEGGLDNDLLDGGTGADTMTGGLGDDCYVVDNALDQVIENANEGIDEIRTTLAVYAIDALLNLENLTGSDIANDLYGNDGANVINGLGGSDYLVGLGGNDVLNGGADQDVLVAGEGDDILDGGTDRDYLLGGAGNDIYFVDNVLDQVIENANEGVDEIRTTLAIYVIDTLPNVENLTGSDLANDLYGNDGANVINGLGGSDYLVGLGGDDILNGGAGGDAIAGGAGNDQLNGGNDNDYLLGGSGDDVLNGGSGNDQLIVEDAGDTVVEAVGGGFDRVIANVTWSLGAGQEIEVIQLADLDATSNKGLSGNEFANDIYGDQGANVLNGGGGGDYLVGQGGDDVLNGGDGGDVLVGGSGTDQLNGGNDNDYLLGGSGNDVLNGGSGNDQLIVEDAGDTVVEAVGGGFDRVIANVSWSLNAGQEIEVIQLSDLNAASSKSLAGNEFSNDIYGDQGSNALYGGGAGDYLVGLGGDDIINGDDGDDVLVGGIGNDLLIGGTGADYLVGDAGADAFAFTSALGAGNIDKILDFVSGSDRIHLSSSVFAAIGIGVLGADAFVVGAAAQDANDRIIYNNATGALLYDADGNGAGAAVQFSILLGSPALTAADFQVI